MAAEEVYVARLGAWIARALGATGSFAVDLDTDSLGFQMPDAIANDPAVTAAGQALAEAGNILHDGGDKLEAAVLSGDNGQLFQAFLRLFEGLYQYVDAADAIVSSINAKAAALPVPERNAVQAFGVTMTRRLIDFFAVTLLEQQLPRLAFLLKLLGLLDWHVVEPSGSLNEPRYVKK